MDQGYHINVAKAKPNGEKRFNSDEPARYHYCNIFVGDIPENIAIDRLREMRERFSAPEFECTMTRWRYSGTQIDAS